MTTQNQLKEFFSDKKPVDIAIIVSMATNREKTSIEELDAEEAEKILRIYRPRQEDYKQTAAYLAELQAKKDIKSHIIALAERTGIKTVGDWEKFNSWMLNRSKFKKHLNAHSLPELQLLYKQMRALEQNESRSAEKPFNKAWWRENEKIKNLN